MLPEINRLFTNSPSFLSGLKLFSCKSIVVNEFIPLKMKIRVEHPIVLKQKVAECSCAGDRRKEWRLTRDNVASTSLTVNVMGRTDRL